MNFDLVKVYLGVENTSEKISQNRYTEIIFKELQENHPEHPYLYQIIDPKNNKNTLLLPEKNEIKTYTFKYTIPSIESEVVNSPSEVIYNDSSKNDNSFKNLIKNF